MPFILFFNTKLNSFLEKGKFFMNLYSPVSNNIFKNLLLFINSDNTKLTSLSLYGLIESNLFT